jgi:transposase
LFCPAIFRWTLPFDEAIFLPYGDSSSFSTGRATMLRFDFQQSLVIGPSGSLAIPSDDAVTCKLAMLIAGECLGLGAVQAALAFGYSKQRYSQLRQAFLEHGAAALVNQKPGPKRNFRRTDEAVRQALRHRFLDPEASADVIAQRLRQSGVLIATRSVERIIEQFGLQKKTASLQAESRAAASHRYPNAQSPSAV